MSDNPLLLTKEETVDALRQFGTSAEFENGMRYETRAIAEAQFAKCAEAVHRVLERYAEGRPRPDIKAWHRIMEMAGFTKAGE